MFKIDSLIQVQNAIKSIRDYKTGYYTNFFTDPQRLNLWLENNILFAIQYNKTFFFLKKNKEFNNTYFCSSDLNNLEDSINRLKIDYSGEIFVFDLVGKKETIPSLVELFKYIGFNIYTSLNRMSRFSSFIEVRSENELIKVCQHKDLKEIKQLLFYYFDIYAEQLPIDDELLQWINSGHLIKYEESKKIIGFIIYDLVGTTSYLRYWFVHPQHRNKKVGACLLKYYFFESKRTKRQIFWVIDSNINAIKRYRHYGFKAEEMVDYVMINKNIKYEGEHN